MTAVAQGGSITLRIIAQNAYGTPVDPQTLALTMYDPDAIESLSVPFEELTRESVGHYAYDWEPAQDAELGAWTETWTGTVEGSEVVASAEVNVVTPGELVIPPVERVAMSEGPWDVGETVPVTHVFHDRYGEEATPETVSLVILAPDGTQDTPTEGYVNDGAYWSIDVPATMAGRWHGEWNADLGAETVVEPVRWYVRPSSVDAEAVS